MPEWYRMMTVIIVNKIVCSPSRFASPLLKVSCGKELEIVVVVFCCNCTICCTNVYRILDGISRQKFIVSCSIPITLCFLLRLRLVLHNIMSWTKNGCLAVLIFWLGGNESCKFIRWHYIVERVQSDFSCWCVLGFWLLSNGEITCDIKSFSIYRWIHLSIYNEFFTIFESSSRV